MKLVKMTNCLLTFWLFLLVYVGIVSEATASNNNLNNNNNSSNFSNPDVYQIGGVLSSDESLANFTNIIQVIDIYQTK